MNQLLEQTKAAVLEKADPRLRPVIDKTVEAGMEVMYSDKTREMFLRQMQGGANPEAVGAGIAKLLGILFNQSKGTLPMEVAVPAATILMCEGLAFLEEAGTVKVDAAFLAECTKAMGSSLLQLFGATPEKLQGIFNQAGQPEPAPAGGGIVAGAMGGA